MIKVFTGIIIALVLLLYVRGWVYFPSDILNLFPIFNPGDKPIPHNTLVSDPLTQFEPWRILVKQQILSGQFPLWNPYNAGGVPLFANAQSAVLFPLNFLYYVLPLGISLNLIAIIKTVLLFTFTLLYLKSLKLKEHSVFVGSTVITFSAFPIVWNLWPHSNVFLFLPLFLYLVEKTVATKKSIFIWHFLLSVTACIAIFGGHYETLLHIIILVFIYSFYRLRNLAKFLRVSLFLFLGVLLASVQVLPFLEYFFNSLVIGERVHSQGLYLPIESFVLNLIPFILGAPHIAFYKSISPLTNFQESIGGYTSVGVFVLAIAGGIVLFKKVNAVAFWLANAIFFTMLSYKIWPVGLLLELPLVSQAQNGRFSAIAAFAIVMMFVYLVENINLLPKLFFRSAYKLITTTLLLGITLVLLVYNISSLIVLPSHPFVPILIDHLAYIILSTSLLIIALFLVLRNGFNKLLLTLLIIGILSQSAFLLINYIPLTSVRVYYPSNEITTKLQSLSRGPVLEIGNPSIIPNINLTYGIDHAQNYDAIEVGKYARAFNDAFEERNHWSKVEDVNANSLRKFGISYLISDYNLNYVKQDLQNNIYRILPLQEEVYEFEFTPNHRNLTGVRVLPANYNRQNDCTFKLEILDQRKSQVFVSQEKKCSEFLDKMYKTVDLPTTILDVDSVYLLRIRSSNASERNAIGLWGDSNRPYAALLFDEGNKEYVELLKTENATLLEVPYSYLVDYVGEYELLLQSATKFVYRVESQYSGEFVLKKTNYPGWEVSLDSKQIDHDDKSPFIKFDVPSGEHIVVIKYVPATFIAGAALSFLTFLLLGIYLVRNLLGYEGFVKTLLSKRKDVTSKIRHISSRKLFMSILVTFLSQATLFFLINRSSIELFQPEYYLVVNWFSVNGSSIYSDYLKTFLYFLSVPISLLVGMIFLLWKR